MRCDCLKSFVFLLFLIVLLISSGCAVSPTARQAGQTSLTVEEEQELGQRAYKQLIQRMGGVYPDKELNKYVNRIGQWLIDGSPYAESKFRFQVLNDSTPNAFSLPDGSVAITRGLLVKLQTDAQLAAVLGAEIGHIVSRHQLQGLRTKDLRFQPVDLLEKLSVGSEYAPLVSSLAKVGADLITKRYSREQELAADRIGVDLMVAAGYQAKAAAAVQEYFLSQAAGDDGLSQLFKKHPFSEKRLKAIQSYINNQYPQGNGRSSETDFSVAVESLRQLEGGYALYDQGRQLEQQGLVAEAIESYHEALLLAPDEPLILASLGLSYLRNEDPVPARRYLLKSVKFQGDYAQSRLGLGYVYIQKWQYAQALSQLEKSMELLPTVEAAFLLADAQQNVGQKVKARDLYLIVASADRNGRLGQLAETRLQQFK